MQEIDPRISVQYEAEAIIITFTDEKILEEADVRAIEQSLLAVIEQGEKLNLVLNFVNVKFLSSAVLGLLIKLSRRIYERDGLLALCGINPKIYEIFKITRLTKVFEIYKDVDAAVEHMLQGKE
jgi:anti-sigma B factor antagonist